MIDESLLSTREDFKNLQKKDPKYWKDSRWEYHKEAAEIIKNFPSQINKVLEIGPNDFKLVKEAVSMGLGGDLDVIHNATISPFPFKDKEFDLVVSFQVWEHLTEKSSGGTPNGPQTAFLEVQRISKAAILSFPYKWKHVPEENCHHMIDEEIIKKWTLNVEPDIVKKVGNRIIYFWNFDK